MASREKTLLVFGPAGAGKATTMGCLLFKVSEIKARKPTVVYSEDEPGEYLANLYHLVWGH